jgi:hypothetical protein
VALAVIVLALVAVALVVGLVARHWPDTGGDGEIDDLIARNRATPRPGMAEPDKARINRPRAP